MTEKMQRMKYLVEIVFEGYGDKEHPDRFQEVCDECVRELHKDVWMGSVSKGCASARIKKPSKVVSREVL